MLNKYQVFKLTLYAVLNPKTMAILGANDCRACITLHSLIFCPLYHILFRDYKTNSSQYCRKNISCLDCFCIPDHECVSSKECSSRSKKCTKCPFCLNNSDCGRDQYCMNRCCSSCKDNPCRLQLSIAL